MVRAASVQQESSEGMVDLVSQHHDHAEEDPSHVNEQNGNSTSAIVIRILLQVTVNALADMSQPDLTRSISDALQKATPGKQVDVLSAMLLDSGDIQINVQMMPGEDLEQLRAWARESEFNIAQPTQTYDAEIHKVVVQSMSIETRLQKAAVIRQLEVANFGRLFAHGQVDQILDVNWVHVPQGKHMALMAVFSKPEVANDAIAKGILWNNFCHACTPRNHGLQLERCNNCQAYGHVFDHCQVPATCGNCAGPHHTNLCKTNIWRCASCGGAHRSGYGGCPVKIAAKSKLRFTAKTQTASEKPTSHQHDTHVLVSRASGIILNAMSSGAAAEPVYSSSVAPLEKELMSRTEINSAKETESAPAQCMDPVRTVLAAFEEMRAEVNNLEAALQDQSAHTKKRTASQSSTIGPHIHLGREVKRLKSNDSGETIRTTLGPLQRQPSLQLSGRSRGNSL